MGDGAWVGDLSNLFMGAVTVESVSGTIPESLFAAFQITFAVITPALIIGAYVERIKFSAVLIFSSLWLLVVYAPVTHWLWGGGIIAGWGVMDFAGGIVVHATAGTAALVAAIVIGKRRSFLPLCSPTQPYFDNERGPYVVGWLVRLQRRLCLSSRPKCSNGTLSDTYFCSCGFAGLDDN